MVISKYFPKPNQIYAVYGLVVLLIYGWTIYWFSWNLPGWLAFIPLGDILGIFSYAVAMNLVESLAVLVVLLLLALILPPKSFREDFVFRAGFMVLYFLVFAMYLLYNFIPLAQLGKLSLIALIVFTPLQYIFSQVRFARNAIEIFADRSTVFLYASIPLGLCGWIVVLIRNL